MILVTPLEIRSNTIKDLEKISRRLFSFLEEQGIRFSQASRDELKDRAVVEFSFNFLVAPFILFGPFQDTTRKIISIAHEAGHVMIYNKMDREEARDYLCTMFVAHAIGLDEVSSKGQKLVLQVEAEASASGLRLLREVGVEEKDLGTVKDMMSRWYTTYEVLCNPNVVKKTKNRILRDEKASFLVCG